MGSWNPDRIAACMQRLSVPQLPRQPRQAAVAVALRLDPEPWVLLMRRAQRPGDPWSGHVSLPGGRREPEDTDLLATAVRETREEVGVDLVTSAAALGGLPALQARARGKRMAMDVFPFVFALTSPVAPTGSDEADEAFWFPLGRAASGELDHPHAYRGSAGLVNMPSWRFEERVVWGMTHRILSTLLEAVLD